MSRYLDKKMLEERFDHTFKFYKLKLTKEGVDWYSLKKGNEVIFWGASEEIRIYLKGLEFASKLMTELMHDI